MKKLIFLIFLTGCTKYDYSGHTNIDINKIKPKMKLQELKETFGKPLEIPFINNTVYYIFSAKQINALRPNKSLKDVMVRISLNDGVVESFEIIEIEPIVYDSFRTEAPEIQIKLFNSIFGNVGGVINVEEEQIKRTFTS